MSKIHLIKEELQSCSIELPYSKSIQNRAQVLAFLSKGKVSYNVLSDADDSLLLHDLLKQIGSLKGDAALHLDCKNAGTVFRFLTAVCCIQRGSFELTGSSRMMERPIGDLVNPLRELGARITYLEQDGFPPLRIEGSELKAEQELKVSALKSSQFLSAMALIAPWVNGGIKLSYDSEMKSKSYFLMTLDLLSQLSVPLANEDTYVNIPAVIPSGHLKIEKDWSSAAFFYSLIALSESGELFFPRLSIKSLQGDQRLIQMFDLLGVATVEEESGIRIHRIPVESRFVSFDFSDCPDLALPVIACCAALQVVARFVGLGNLKYKESNRLEVLKVELQKFNYDLRVVSDDEAVLINDCKGGSCVPKVEAVSIAAYGDHRMAMSLAPLVLLHETMFIQDADVVEKSFPNFWKELAKAGIRIIK